MTLNHHATAQSLCGQLPPATCIGEDVADDNVPQESQEDSETLQAANPQSGQIPRKTTSGRQVYRLQKSIEEALGGCRTLAFMTNDITALESALAQCQSLAETLMSSATISEGLNCPPVFHASALKLEFRSSKQKAKLSNVSERRESAAVKKNQLTQN